jgi:hypothetical protein
VDLEELGWSYAHFGVWWKGKEYENEVRGYAKVTVGEFCGLHAEVNSNP